MVTASRYTFETCDVTKLSDADTASLARLVQELDRERMPEDPPAPLGLIERRIRNRPALADQIDWVARSDGEIVGRAFLLRWTSLENLHWRDAWVGVHPGHRRRGIARELLARVVAAGAGDAEIVMGSWANDRVAAGGEFARRIGATEGLNNRTSQLTLAEIDRGMVAEWARIDPAGYRLAWIDGNVPDELIPNVITAYDTMNTAPRGELQFGDFHTTAEEIRDWERVRNSNGGVHRLVLALHEVTGATAGFTEVIRHPMTPWSVNQQGTAVVPEHRGHGIGKWIKAAMIERVLREWPEAKYIRTGNAYSNAPMLSINDRLGFTVLFSVVVWQLRLADAERYLEARGRHEDAGLAEVRAEGARLARP